MTNAVLNTLPNLSNIKDLIKNQKCISIEKSTQWRTKFKPIDDMTREEFREYLNYLARR
jgi:hypothetical protein